MRYDLATLTIKPGSTGRVIPAVDAWSKAGEARGSLLGCWLSDAGENAALTLFRSFADEAEMFAERWRTLATTEPFGCGGEIVDLRLESYAPFPWVPAVKPGRYGQIYEIRTYRLKHGGVPGTIAAWQAAMPARSAYSPLVMAMYALDGSPRFTHIWPYRSLDERNRIRSEAVDKGVWPPTGAPEWLTGEIDKKIGVPTPISRLQ